MPLKKSLSSFILLLHFHAFGIQNPDEMQLLIKLQMDLSHLNEQKLTDF